MFIVFCWKIILWLANYIKQLKFDQYQHISENIRIYLPKVRATENDDGGIEVTLIKPQHDEAITLYPNDRYLCNPGSVGQPRDGDPRASFAVLDYLSPDSESTFTLYRTEYDIEKAKMETHRVGLPSGLAERLEDGL